MMLKYCLTCDGHHTVGQTCAKREAQRYAASRERRTRGTAKWKAARAAARQRDGQRCTGCGTDKGLQVHHRVALKDGGAKYELANLETLCSDCHADRHRGEGATRKRPPLHPSPVLREEIPGKVDEGPLVG
jgi:5-methylcytosine-specific restriction endonuclease McrA